MEVRGLEATPGCGPLVRLGKWRASSPHLRGFGGRGRVGAEAERRAGVEGSSLGSPPQLHASLLPLQPPDPIHFKPRGPQLVGLPDSWADVRVLLDADCDLTPVLPLHVCHGVEASYGNHRCHLQEG